MSIKFKLTHGDYTVTGTTATVNCNGKKLAEDIVIEAVSESEEETITVTLIDSTSIHYGEYTIPKGSRADVLMEYNSAFNYHSGSDVLTYDGENLKFLVSDEYVFRDTILSTDVTIYFPHSSGGLN